MLTSCNIFSSSSTTKIFIISYTLSCKKYLDYDVTLLFIVLVGGGSVKVSEVSKLTGVSVRTLHYYDEIGLLKPDSIGENNYRLYHERNLQQLQQILFFRELGIPLKKIKNIIQNPEFDSIEALEMQRNVLEDKKKKLEELITTIDKTIQYERGEIKMTKEERFNGFDFDTNEYEREARERWGDEAVDTSKEKVKQLKKSGEQDFEVIMNERFRKLAALRHHRPDSEAAQAAIAGWYEELNKIGNYSLEAFQGLGEMYVHDERFTKNIDQFGEGLAQFMCEAMREFVNRNK